MTTNGQFVTISCPLSGGGTTKYRSNRVIDRKGVIARIDLPENRRRRQSILKDVGYKSQIGIAFPAHGHRRPLPQQLHRDPRRRTTGGLLNGGIERFHDTLAEGGAYHPCTTPTTNVPAEHN